MASGRTAGIDNIRFYRELCFMLFVATPPNAIVFGTGMIPVARMAREELAFNFMGALVITLMCYWFIA